MRRPITLLMALGLAGLVGACTVRDTAREAERKKDPNMPAVVQGPKIVLPSDTAHPDTMQDHKDRMAVLARQVQEPYALIGAAIGFSDTRLFGSIFAPDAVFIFGDSTYTGVEHITKALIDMGRRSGLTEVNRVSRAFNGEGDSIYVDSGDYLMRAQRPGGAKREEGGTYVSTWRHLGPPAGWVLRRDEIRPFPPAKKR